MLLTSVASVDKARYSLLFCAIDLYCGCCIVKNASMTRTVTLGDILLTITMDTVIYSDSVPQIHTLLL